MVLDADIDTKGMKNWEGTKTKSTIIKKWREEKRERKRTVKDKIKRNEVPRNDVERRGSKRTFSIKSQKDNTNK